MPRESIGTFALSDVLSNNNRPTAVDRGLDWSTAEDPITNHNSIDNPVGMNLLQRNGHSKSPGLEPIVERRSKADNGHFQDANSVEDVNNRISMVSSNRLNLGNRDEDSRTWRTRIREERERLTGSAKGHWNNYSQKVILHRNLTILAILVLLVIAIGLVVTAIVVVLNDSTTDKYYLNFCLNETTCINNCSTSNDNCNGLDCPLNEAQLEKEISLILSTTFTVRKLEMLNGNQDLGSMLIYLVTIDKVNQTVFRESAQELLQNVTSKKLTRENDTFIITCVNVTVPLYSIANTTESQSTSNTTESQSTANTTESQSTANTTESQSIVNTTESQSTANTTESQSTATTTESQSIVNTTESQSTANTTESQSIANTTESQFIANTTVSQSIASTA